MLKTIVILLAAAGVVTMTGCATTKDEIASGLIRTVNAAATPLSPQEEDAIGSVAAARLLGASPLVQNAELQRHVNRVGSWVASHSEKPNLNWHFAVIKDTGINSFAAPGGYIVITQGLYDRLDNEAELAAVLGHEITHVSHGHHSASIQAARAKAEATNFASTAVQNEVGRRYGNGVGSLSGKAIANIADRVVEDLFIKGYNKDQEYDADVNGMVLTARSGYNPFALVAVLQKIGSMKSDSPETQLLEDTHPSIKDRLVMIEKYAEGKLEPFANGVEEPKRVAERSTPVKKVAPSKGKRK